MNIPATTAYLQPYVHPHREVTNHADYLRVPHQMGVLDQLLANSVPKDLLISDDTIPETVQTEPVVVAATVASGAGKSDEEEYNQFDEEFPQDKNLASTDCEEIIEEVAERIEKDLILLAATTVEDKL
ncbi:hypothetical protein VitviT2T_028546 [Vitis vinifera]|uniref:Uncharacterized protein n=1 Tax=Vitis vinifera TaxID=29760 RepID=A0ABY9DX02_VITVI|nr:hypothetical protein VitviT2T_028546 [Vitis vinifera]